LADQHRESAIVIDGAGTPDEVHARVLQGLPGDGWGP
jgi:hypothetical protein